MRGEYGRFTCPHNKGPHNKDHTTALPNTRIYDINASALVGYRGDQKRCTNVHSLLLSRQKRGRKTEKSQSGLKTANIRQKTCCLDTEFVYTDPQISKILNQIQFVCLLFYCFRLPFRLPLIQFTSL